MKIREVVANNYAEVFALPAAERTAQIKAVQYVQNLANSVKVDIGEWDLFQVFGSGNGKIYQIKPSLNERFFKHLATLPKQTEVPAELIALSPELIASVDRAALYQRDRLKRKAEEERDRFIQKALTRHEDVQSFLTSAVERANTLRAITGERPNLPQEIQKINEAGFWQFEKHDTLSRSLHFVTRADVYASHVNSAAKVDINVNFGLFRCIFNLPTAQMCVKGAGNNIEMPSGYHHPHVSSDGHVCWGSAADMVMNALPMYKIAGVFEALSIILTHYNQDSPYETIERFYAQSQREKCAKCLVFKDSDGSCSCNECEVCHKWYNDNHARQCDCCLMCEKEVCICAEIEAERRRTDKWGMSVTNTPIKDPSRSDHLNDVIYRTWCRGANGKFNRNALVQERANQSRVGALPEDVRQFFEESIAWFDTPIYPRYIIAEAREDAF